MGHQLSMAYNGAYKTLIVTLQLLINAPKLPFQEGLGRALAYVGIR